MALLRSGPLRSEPSVERWLLPSALPPAPFAGDADVDACGLPPELLAVLWRRGHRSGETVSRLLNPPEAPEPREHFPDLVAAERRLEQACSAGEAVAVCGDYDADGMTSTALLVGVLQRLGARPTAAIPSRQEEGYGLNPGMVERLSSEGIGLLITVDNGVSALEALERADALGVEVILTDHHSLPPQLPPHRALLHPATTPEGSPYRGLAGVGLAYVLARGLCRRLARPDALAMALDLFCIGTIADMAPLEGVNRRWLMDGLPRLGRSALPGLQALKQMAGIEDLPFDAQTVGFQIAPRINAVGRLGDPRLVVDLLTTADGTEALELARECEAMNRQRRELCDAIEAEALALVEADGPARAPFLLLAQSHWHHGVIGIVASRLVDRFGLPVALLAGEGNGRLRASVRAPKGFAVDRALAASADLLERHGGHPAAGGFTVLAGRVAELQVRLENLAREWLGDGGASRSVEPEALLRLERIDRLFHTQLQRLEPFGIGHPDPLFWSSGCQVEEARLLRGGHLQLRVSQGGCERRAIGWRWQGCTLPSGLVDLAYRLRLDRWQGQERLQLELTAIRTRQGEEVLLQRRGRSYWCRCEGDGVVIRNAAGDERRMPAGGSASGDALRGEASHSPYLRTLFLDAATALGLAG
ncbi:MAG: single-stranded-DNA-specific exonuclease RecJ [Cyanobium sp.]